MKPVDENDTRQANLKRESAHVFLPRPQFQTVALLEAFESMRRDDSSISGLQSKSSIQHESRSIPYAPLLWGALEHSLMTQDELSDKAVAMGLTEKELLATNSKMNSGKSLDERESKSTAPAVRPNFKKRSGYSARSA